MKIVYKVIKSGSGNDVYFERLAQGIRNSGHDVNLIYYPKYFQYFPLLLKLINQHVDADIIHTNIEYAWVFKQKKTKLFATTHHNVFDPEYKKITSLFQKIFHYLVIKPNSWLSLKLINTLIAVSYFSKHSFQKTFGSFPITVIYNGIDTNIFKPLKVKRLNKNKISLFFVGNLTKRKGADLLPQIMDKLGVDYVLYYTKGLRSKPPNNFNKKNMISLGKLSESELVKWYNKTDILLYPSRFEGFGYAVVEAMACGLPIVCGNNSSLRELVEDRKNGLLSKTHDVNDYIKNIILLTSQSETVKNINKNNQEKIKRNFSLPYMIESYIKTYSSVFKKPL